MEHIKDVNLMNKLTKPSMRARCPKCKSNDIVIVQYKWYYHYFNSTTGTPRPCESSVIYCLFCHNDWRTTAKYIEQLKGQGKVSANEKRNMITVAENRQRLLAGNVSE